MDLNELRLEIDQIDDQLVRLFVKRMEVSARIADYKKQNHLPILAPAREAEKLADVAQKAGGDMAVYTRVLYDLLFELSRGYQSKRNAAKSPLYLRVSDAIAHTEALLPRHAAVAFASDGTEEAELVCRKMFGPCHPMEFKNTDGIFNAIAQGLCEYGMIALDTGTKQIYDRLAAQGLYILRCLRLDGGKQYICVSRQLAIYPGADRSSIMMTLSDKPGALHKVLSRLYTLGINVVRLESRPVTQQHFRGLFYFDLECSIYSEEFVLFMCELEDLCEEFTYLGSYTEVV